jgi:hypothetical protein
MVGGKMTHKKLSFIKSGLRIAGFAIIIFSTYSMTIFAVFSLLAIAEIVGVVEEC